jgi:hypothetical protein
MALVLPTMSLMSNAKQHLRDTSKHREMTRRGRERTSATSRGNELPFSGPLGWEKCRANGVGWRMRLESAKEASQNTIYTYVVEASYRITRL